MTFPAYIPVLFLAPIFLSLPIALAWVYRPGAAWARKLPILSVLGLFISLIISLYILFRVPSESVTIQWLPGFDINFVFTFDYLSKYMGALTAFIAFLIGVYGLEYMKDDYRLGWYWFFFNTFTASMLLVVYSDNLLMLLIGWEGLGLASWGLIGHWFRDDDDLSYVGDSKRRIGPLRLFWSPTTGGWRAISTIRFGDMPMFFAIAAIYALTGTLDISQIPWGDMFQKIGIAGTVILLFAFLLGPFTKSAQLPFSEWLMTAMTGPTTVSALLHSATMVAAGTYLFMKITWYIKPWELEGVPGLEIIYLLVLFLGLISALYGALVATGLLERKVLLAASTMSSLGLMFAAASTSFWLGKIGLLVAFWYLMVHAFAKATLFLVAGHLIHVTHSRFCEGDLELGKKMKIGFGATIIATTFLAGIPPLTAYWVKSGMDELMVELIHDVGALPLILLIAVSVVYAAFLAKFLSLNFIKGTRPHHIDLHGGQLMSSAYAIMVSLMFVLLYVIIREIDPSTSTFFEAGLEKTSFLVGIAVLITYSGGLIMPRIRALANVGFVLSDRLYLPFLNDYIIPGIGWVIASIVDHANRGIDSLFHRWVPEFFERISRDIRKLQTGSLPIYIQIVSGIIIAILIIGALMGWR